MNHIRIPDGYELDPMLSELVNKLSMEKPDWVFDCMYKDAYLTTNNHQRAVKQPGVAEEKRFLRKITIKNSEGQVMGTLRVDRESWGRFANSGNPHIYIVESWRIHKERGNRNQTKTSKIESAVREAKKHFGAMTRKEFMEKASEGIRSGFRDCTNNLVRAFQIQCDKLPIYTYATLHYSQMRCLPVNETDAAEVRELVTSDKFEASLKDFLLSRTMSGYHRTDNMAFIVEYQGDFLVAGDVIGEDAPVARMRFEEMPQDWQERISVLQLMQDDELVLDVGYRKAHGRYFVVVK